MDKGDPIQLSGDACAAVLTSAQVLGALDVLPIDLASDARRSEITQAINALDLGFEATKLENQRAYLAGQGTNCVANFDDALIGLEAKPGPDGAAARFKATLAERLNSVVAARLDVGSIHAIVFRTGLISVRVFLRLQQGWREDEVLAVLGEGARDTLAGICNEVLSEALTPVKDALARVLKQKGGSAAALSDTIAAAVLEFPSIHIVYGGVAQGCDARVDYLDERYRRIFYMTSADRITSHSPHPGEFVRFGYAFSVVARAEDVETRVHEATLCVRIQHMLFHQLVGLCEYIERQNGAADTHLSADRAKWVRRAIVQGINRLRSGVYTYRHEMIVFQDRVFEAWFLDRLVARARDALQDLVDEREQAERRSQARRDFALAMLLAVIAVFSLVSVVADFFEIAERLGS